MSTPMRFFHSIERTIGNARVRITTEVTPETAQRLRDVPFTETQSRRLVIETIAAELCALACTQDECES